MTGCNSPISDATGLFHGCRYRRAGYLPAAMFAGRAKLPNSRLGTQWVPVHSAWFNSELVVYSGPEPLLTADVAFRSLHRDMAEKELDLFKFSAGGMAKPRTRSAKVVG